MRAVNLLPREAPKRKVQMTLGLQLALVAPLVVASLIAAGVMMESSKVRGNKETLKALEAQLATLPPPATQPSGNTQLALQKSQRVTALVSALQSRVAWDRILREISSVLPEDVWLTALSVESPQSAAPPPAPEPTTPDTSGADGTSTTETTTTPAPVAPAPTSAPLGISGYTYSQEGVARLMSRLAVIPELTDVTLVASTTAPVSGRDVIQFAIKAGIKPQGASS